jgi:hypothetical protein
MTSLAGFGEAFASVLRSLGYRMEAAETGRAGARVCAVGIRRPSGWSRRRLRKPWRPFLCRLTEVRSLRGACTCGRCGTDLERASRYRGACGGRSGARSDSRSAGTRRAPRTGERAGAGRGRRGAGRHPRGANHRPHRGDGTNWGGDGGPGQFDAGASTRGCLQDGRKDGLGAHGAHRGLAAGTARRPCAQTASRERAAAASAAAPAAHAVTCGGVRWSSRCGVAEARRRGGRDAGAAPDQRRDGGGIARSAGAERLERPERQQIRISVPTVVCVPSARAAQSRNAGSVAAVGRRHVVTVQTVTQRCGRNTSKGGARAGTAAIANLIRIPRSPSLRR